MSLVWVTRALPAAQATAERVRALGLEAVVAPLLEVRGLGEGAIDLIDVAAIAFTSANGVRAFAARSEVRDLRVFAVGQATARIARSAGFANVSSAEGDVAALGRLIGAVGGLSGVILHVGAAQLAGNLVGDLAGAGVGARRLDLYCTEERNLSDVELAELAAADFALVHSPRTAMALRQALVRRPVPDLRVLCLSPAVAAPLVGMPLGGLGAAPAPTETSLLDMLAQWSGRS